MTAATEGTATKGAQTRRRLLDAAASEVARKGAAGASLTEIARVAGLRTGSVYFHFPSKDDLLESVLEEGLRESLRHLGDAIAEHPATRDPSRRLRRAIRGHLTALAELKDYAVVVLAQDVTTAEGSLASFHALRRDYLDRWTVLVGEAQAAGALPPDVDARSARDLVLGALNAVGLAGTPPDEAESAICALLRLPPEATDPV